MRCLLSETNLSIQQNAICILVLRFSKSLFTASFDILEKSNNELDLFTASLLGAKHISNQASKHACCALSIGHYEIVFFLFLKWLTGVETMLSTVVVDKSV